MRCQLASPRLEFRTQFELVLRNPRLAEHAVVHVFEGQARAGVGAVAHAHGGCLQRKLLDPDENGRRIRVRRVRIDLDHRTLEEPGLLQALLIVEQQLLVVGLAWPEGREPAHAVFAVARQAFDAYRAQVEERPAVGEQGERDGVGLRVDAGGGRHPTRGRIALGTKLREGHVLRVVPGGLAKWVADLQAPAAAQGGEFDDCVFIIGIHELFQIAADVDRPLVDDRAWAGYHCHAKQRNAVARLGTRDVHLSVEIALGLEQRACLRGRRGHEPVEFGTGDAVGGGRVLETRQVEVAQQQLA